jgi:Inner membrane component of T3SS, cytoplasmic domain
MDAQILRYDRYSPPEAHILPVGPRVALEVTRGRVRHRVRPVQGRVFLIGTASDCDLVLGDLTFPEAYAYLFVQGSAVSIRRLGAGPELAVCGERVESAELSDGDRVEFGPFELRVRIDAAAGRRPRPVEPTEESADEVSLLLNQIREGLAAASAEHEASHEEDTAERNLAGTGERMFHRVIS